MTPERRRRRICDDDADRGAGPPRWMDEDPERTAWLRTWAPDCPAGRPQRLRHAGAYRELEAGRLQLRVALDVTEGICDVIVVEDEETVTVRVLVCYEDEGSAPRGDRVDCPVGVGLDRPLGGRTVVDCDTGEPLPLFVPPW